MIRIAGNCALFCVFIILAWGCHSKEQAEEPKDNYYQGTIHVSCDESFKPVIDAEVAVYQNSFPDTKIIVHYKPEADCLRDLAVDSIRMVIATRTFTEPERFYMIDSLNVQPTSDVVAKDAIAVIVHPSNPDSFFTMQKIRDLVGGKLKENLRNKRKSSKRLIVWDNCSWRNSTSTSWCRR